MNCYSFFTCEINTYTIKRKISQYVYRFLPIQMFFVGCSTLLPLMGDGPMWHENIDPIVDGCKKDWWTNFLFINNLYRSTDRGVSIIKHCKRDTEYIHIFF